MKKDIIALVAMLIGLSIGVILPVLLFGWGKILILIFVCLSISFINDKPWKNKIKNS